MKNCYYKVKFKLRLYVLGVMSPPSGSPKRHWLDKKPTLRTLSEMRRFCTENFFTKLWGAW